MPRKEPVRTAHVDIQLVYVMSRNQEASKQASSTPPRPKENVLNAHTKVEEAPCNAVGTQESVTIVERVLVLALATACVLDGRDVIPFQGCVAAFNRRTKTALLPVMGRFNACKGRQRTSSERDVRFSQPRDLRGFDDTWTSHQKITIFTSTLFSKEGS